MALNDDYSAEAERQKTLLRVVIVALLLSSVIFTTGLRIHQEPHYQTKPTPSPTSNPGPINRWPVEIFETIESQILTPIPPKASSYQAFLPLVSSSKPTPSPTPTSTPTSTPSPTPTSTPTPLPTPDGRIREVKVPILVYHYISPPPPGADAIRLDLSVLPENFEEQLRYLKEAGYTSITLHDLIYHLALGWPLPEKPIVLTFDDGYRDNYTNAYPLLKKYGFVGVFFLITSPIDKGDEEYLSWEQVKEMSEGGMEMECHTYTHPDLRGKSADYIIWQVVGSKEAIEERTGRTVRFLSYPFGFRDEMVISILRSADFWGAVTMDPGTIQSSERTFEMFRVRVRGSDTLDKFVEKLDLANR